VELDHAFNDALVYDGTGNPPRRASVGIAGGRIIQISSKPLQAKSRISCEGLALCPGFIDMHSHSDVVSLAERGLKRKMASEKVMQGVATEVNGNCSFSAAPVSQEYKHLLADFMEPLGHFDYAITWKTYRDFLSTVEEAGLATNFVGLVGHGALRIAAMGMQSREANDGELAMMKSMLDDSLSGGAFGLSTGLLYTPGSYAGSQELVELCRVVAAHNGIVASHMRDYGDHIQDSVNEVLGWARATHVPVQISHYMLVGHLNWGRSRNAADLIDAARKEKLDVAFDQYPYTAGMTDLKAALPPWTAEGGPDEFKKRLKDPRSRQQAKLDMVQGLERWESISRRIGWENVVIGFCENRKDLEGKSISQCASIEGKSAEDFVFDLLLAEPASPLVVIHMMSEADVKFLMRHPLQMFGTDGIPTPGKTHPRTLGSYPRILRKFVIEDGVLTIQDAIRRMTSFPASRMGLRDRGIVAEGFAADLVVFDPERIKDRATFEQPNQYPEGINHVFVNGVPSVFEGEYQESYSGKVLTPR
jgi:N-acyl-D-aspartate/D-glutamate deacylase